MDQKETKEQHEGLTLWESFHRNLLSHKTIKNTLSNTPVTSQFCTWLGDPGDTFLLSSHF